jgi:hypothetical protein
MRGTTFYIHAWQVWDPEEGILVRTLETGTYPGNLPVVVEVRP